ncbi:MAG: hypothetical protein HMLKMBBP_01269 [Planctomycetes bacterium]|nr:hypothetical protein [Planctomycetota bacterium]
MYEFPLPVGTAADPRLFARVTRDGLPPRIAVIGMRDGSLDTLWAWPSSVGDRPLETLLRPFAPAAVETQRGAFVAFPWPAIGSGRSPRFDELVDDDDARNELVLLGLSGEGRVADVRGRDEKERDDGDAEFETLSFCGRPAVSGGAVYVTAVRFAEKSEATELHVARFDVAGSADAPRLRLRWRRHVLDGTAMPSARFPANEARGVATAGSNEESGPAVAFPSSPTVLAGRVFVCSNTGAVACLDAASGEPEWIETYERFGPSSRITIRQAVPRTWEDVALHADGAFVYAAPLDSEHMIQFRRAPRRARSVRVETFPLAAAGGTATRAGALPSDLAPDQIASIRDGVAVLSGRVTRRALGALPTPASPLVFFDVAARRLATAQVQESAASGIPTPVRGGVLFPTPKAIYRVPLGSTEAAPQVLWRNDAKETEPRRMLALLDRVGNLVPDGAHVWSVTPSRIVLLRAAAK